jgi:hypothetical protein
MTVHPRHLNVGRPPAQRAIDDVLVRITPTRGDVPGTIMYMSRGRAEMALMRYSAARYRDHPLQRFIVERLTTETEES